MSNFVCDLEVKRKQMVPVVVDGSTTVVRRQDFMTAEVTYLNGQAQLGNVRINGKPTDDPTPLTLGIGRAANSHRLRWPS